MTVKQILKNFDPEEIASAFVLPVKLTKKEQKEAAEQLAEARRKFREQSAKIEYIKANLLQLKSQIHDYARSEQYDPNKRFGQFFKTYLFIINKKSSEFAEEINIHETLVSQLINNHREPNEDILVRLELHSNNNIPAHYWYMLIQKDHINQLMTDKALRKREKKNVKKRIKVKK
jgi:hypothetical protein